MRHRLRLQWFVLLIVVCSVLLATLGISAATASPSVPTTKSIVQSHDDPFDTGGYWLAASDGGIFNYGHSGFLGSAGSVPLNKPIVGAAATPDGNGYWMVASDGGIFSFGDAPFYGSAGSIPLNKPIVGMATTPDGDGYWMVASDGGIFSFGDAPFYGSAGSIPLNQPIVGMAPTPDGRGYWLAASDGGIFTYGDAAFYGSAGSMPLNQPIVGMAAAPDGGGYWLAASDGGIFNYGDARYLGSPGSTHLNKPVVGMAALPEGHGFWNPSDGCHYYLLSGQWYGDYCVRYGNHADGSIDSNLWNFWAYPGPGQQLTQIIFQADRTSPAYLSVRMLTIPAIFNLVAWVRWPANDLTAPAQFDVCTQPPGGGQCWWLTIATMQAIEARQEQGQPTIVTVQIDTLPSGGALNATGAVVEGDTNTAIVNMSLVNGQSTCLVTGNCSVDPTIGRQQANAHDVVPRIAQIPTTTMAGGARPLSVPDQR